MHSTNKNQIDMKNVAIQESIKNKIENEYYQEFENEQELKDVFGKENSFQSILPYLADGYTMEQLTNLGISAKEMELFRKYLASNNLTISNAIAINQYSNGSNMILSLKKKNNTKEEIKTSILSELTHKLKERRFVRYNSYRRICSKFELCITVISKFSTFKQVFSRTEIAEKYFRFN